MFEQFQFSDGEVEVLAEMLDLVWEDAAARSGAGWCGQLRHGSSKNWTRILIILYIYIYCQRELSGTTHISCGM